MIMSVARGLGLSVPSDLSVLSVGVSTPINKSSPTITVVRHEPREVRTTAADLLLSMLRGTATAEARRVVFPAELLVHVACAAPRQAAKSNGRPAADLRGLSSALLTGVGGASIAISLLTGEAQMAYEARYVFRPNAGADMAVVIKTMQEGAALWRKHGAPSPTLWTITAGELGNYVLVVRFENAAEYAKVVDPLSADPDFRRWQARNVETGQITWVRSNLAREVELAG